MSIKLFSDFKFDDTNFAEKTKHDDSTRTSLTQSQFETVIEKPLAKPLDTQFIESVSEEERSSSEEEIHDKTQASDDKVQNMATKSQNDVSQSTTSDIATQAYDDVLQAVREIADKNGKIKTVKEVYFASSKIKRTNGHNLDKSALAPSASTILSKHFEASYLGELTDRLMSNRSADTVDIGFIIGVSLLYEKIKDKKYPIYVYSTKYPKFTNRAVFVLNRFFSERMFLIRSIYELMNGMHKDA